MAERAAGEGARLVVFAKAPRPGAVKTRLAAAIGAEAAARAQADMTAAVLSRLAGSGPWTSLLAVAPDEAADDPALWPADVPRAPQGPGDLGERMARFLGGAAPDAPVVLVGSDIPAMAPANVARAFRSLRDCDLVFGPARDGGFWLVGTRGPLPAGLFSGVRWSMPGVLAAVLARAGGARVALTDVLEDVDDLPAYRRWRGGGP